MTPTNQAVNYIINFRSMAIVATKDGIFTQDCISQVQEHKNVELILIEDANRYLEVSGNIDETLKILGQVVSLYKSLFNKYR